jgi:hypothetical protein
MKLYDGSLHLLAAKNWLILKNAKSAPIFVKALSTDQVTNARKVFCLGAKVNFPQHAVRVGKCLSVPNVLKPLASSSADDLHQDSASAAIPSESDSVSEEHVQADDRENSITHPEQEFSSVVYDSLSMGLDFSPGKSFAKLIHRRFFSSVHSSIDTAHFTLVVSFGHANFCLSEESVGIALEAAIGGYCGHLKVSLLHERVYSFVVSSKQVGFEIIKKRFYSCQQFKCYFNLWGLGGPIWAREFRLWQNECNEEWTLVSPSKKHLAQGVKALKLAKPKSAIKKSYAVKKKLTFASTLDYVARKGYTNDSPVQKSIDIVTVLAKASNESTLRDVVVSNVIPSDTIPSISKHLNKGKAPVDLMKNSDNDGLDEVVNDIAFRFWKCSKCLSMDHLWDTCTNRIHCWGYFHYGHKERNCFNKVVGARQWVPKKLGLWSDRMDLPLAVSASNTNISSERPCLAGSYWVSPPPSTPPPPQPPKIEPDPMAVFELDPTPWLPWGHQIIDGGDTRLPRSYYNPANDPPQLHQAFCVAIVEPAPPAMHEGLWHDQVRDFLTGPLNRQVIDY